MPAPTTSPPCPVEHTACRSCGSAALTELFSLGDQYVSDFPAEPANPGSSRPVPITLDLCPGCGLVQQRWTAPQDLLYTRHYWYRSGVTETMRLALRDVVESVSRLVKLCPGDVVLDIGSNDGTLLRNYPADVVRVGVEPASNLATPDNYGAHGLELVHDFWPPTSGRVLPYDRAKVITACGMLYDLEDPNQFVADVARVLHPEGLFVAQLMCLRGMFEKSDVGNLCHEHLEFYSLRSLEALLARHGLRVVDVELNGVNGGSYRLYVRHAVSGRPPGPWVEVCREEERLLRLDDPETLRGWWVRAGANLRRCRDFILEEVQVGRKEVWVYGASTKGNVLLQAMGLTGKHLTAAADRSPEKWGRYTVGTGVPIRSEEEFRRADPDYALVLPYAFLQEFLRREEAWRARGGRFLVPLPLFEVV